MTATLRLLSCVLVAALGVSGCSVARVETGQKDDLSTWGAEPLPPDPGLQATAVGANSSCSAGAGGGQVRILLQDRRTQWSAAFLFTSAASLGSCFVTTAQGGSGGGSGPLPGQMTSELSIDDNGAGNLADGKVRELGGRIGASVVGVNVELEDGRVVTASVGNGYWLAWWPDGVRASVVTAHDAAGAVVETVEVPA